MMMMRVFVVVMMFLGVGLMSVEAQTSCAGTSLFYEKKREKGRQTSWRPRRRSSKEREREREETERKNNVCVSALDMCV